MILERKVNRLEAALGEFIIQQNSFLTRFENEMSDFRDEMKAFKDELRFETKEFKDEMKEFKDEAKADRKAMNKKWSELAQKMGTVVEYLVVPNINFIAEKYFRLNNCDDFMIRRKRQKSDDKSKKKV